MILVHQLATPIPSPSHLNRLMGTRDRLLAFGWDFEIESRIGRFPPDSSGPGILGPEPEHDVVPKLNRKGLLAIKGHYYERFLTLIPVALEFFDALTAAGGQHLLARRAGLPDLDPPVFPSDGVRHGPLRVPIVKKPDFDAFEEHVGGSHSVGARLLWWCAASGRPWSFGYCTDLSWQVWTRLPWLEVWDDRVVLSDGPLATIKDCATFLFGLLASGEANESFRQEGLAHRTPIRCEGAPEMHGAQPDGAIDATPDIAFAESWAVGQHKRDCWHLFGRSDDRWVYRRRIDFGGRPRAGCKLLEEFLRGHGTLSTRGAFEALSATKFDPEDLDLDLLEKLGGREVFEQVKTEVSHLRRSLRASMRERDCQPIDRYESGIGYKLLMSIGYSIEGLDDESRGTHHFEFRSVSHPSPELDQLPGQNPPSEGLRRTRATRRRLR